MYKKIIILFLVLTTIVLVINRKDTLLTFQELPETGYKIYIEHNLKYNILSGEGDDVFGYIGGIALEYFKDSGIYFADFDYRLQNNGDDTPSEISETGAAPFPPQPQELIYPLTDEYEKVGEWLGYNLYIEKEIKQFGYIYQEVFPNQLTEQMTLLSEDKARVNYYDRFIISYNFSEQESLEKQRKEFLKILNSMEITEIEN